MLFNVFILILNLCIGAKEMTLNQYLDNRIAVELEVDLDRS